MPKLSFSSLSRENMTVELELMQSHKVGLTVDMYAAVKSNLS